MSIFYWKIQFEALAEGSLNFSGPLCNQCHTSITFLLICSSCDLPMSNVASHSFLERRTMKRDKQLMHVISDKQKARIGLWNHNNWHLCFRGMPSVTKSKSVFVVVFFSLSVCEGRFMNNLTVAFVLWIYHFKSIVVDNNKGRRIMITSFIIIVSLYKVFSIYFSNLS